MTTQWYVTAPYYSVHVGVLLYSRYRMLADAHGCAGTGGTRPVMKGTRVELTDPIRNLPIASIALGEGSTTKDYRGESCSFGGDEDHVKITSDAVRVTVTGLVGSVIERVNRYCDVERCRFLIDYRRPTPA